MASEHDRDGNAWLSTARLALVAVAAGAGVMVLEITAPRLVAPQLGTSALVWTTVLATFLLGIAVGNLLGGRLADRRPRALLLLLLLLGAALTFILPPLHALVSGATERLPHTARTLVAVPLTFLPVAIALGTVPAVVARHMLALGARPGLRLGLVAGAGAGGSVAGTFLAGFGLLPSLGLGAIITTTGAFLVLTVLVAPWGRGGAATRTPIAGSASTRTFLLLAFLQGFAVLAFEILAGRLASDRLGASVYTWTSVIGVVLAGLTIGAFVGGRLADRFAPRALVSWLFLAASIGCATLLWAPSLLDLADGWVDSGRLAWPNAVLAACLLTFLLPSIALGCLAPAVVRSALRDPSADGRIVGTLYAAGTTGAVLACVGLGYLLIPMAGLERLAILLAFVLASASGSLRGRQPYAWIGVLLLLAAGVQGPWPSLREIARDLQIGDGAITLVTEDSRHARVRVLPIVKRWTPCAESIDPLILSLTPALRGQAYYDGGERRLEWVGPMTVAQRDALYELVSTDAGFDAVDRIAALSAHEHRELHIDRLVHGYVDLQDPLWLGYGYERLYAAALPPLWPKQADEPVRCLFIGGGAYAFQGRLLAMHGEGVRLVTAEIDPVVTEVARAHLGLADDPRHVIVHEDARTYVATRPLNEQPFDIVFGDAFDDIAVPFHLTTETFHEDLARRMAPGGVYVVNVVDRWSSGLFLGAFVSTLKRTFDHVTILSAAPRMPDTRYTYVVVASSAPLPFEAGVFETADGEAVQVCTQDEIAALQDRAGHRILTDDHAPVESLLAPVLETRDPLDD